MMTNTHYYHNDIEYDNNNSNTIDDNMSSHHQDKNDNDSIIKSQCFYFNNSDSDKQNKLSLTSSSCHRSIVFNIGFFRMMTFLLLISSNYGASSTLLSSIATSPHLIPCNQTIDECGLYLRHGSICLSTGYCSNPFHNSGCLSNYYSHNNRTFGSDKFWNRTKNWLKRVCTSIDTDESIMNGYCRPQTWNYSEIRFMGNNWESIFFETWIVQILLTEVLGVPTSVDTGHYDKFIDFYDIHNRFDYGKAYDWNALKKANEVKDCRLLQSKNKNIINNSDYISCAHVSLEVWEGQLFDMDELFSNDVAEKTSSMGVLGNGGWYIPKFTAAQHPNFLSYLGLQGNREQLAALFLRPTKWIDYCREVSTSNCTIPDNVALRPPTSADEEIRYYYEGSYTGYFRNTSENDCQLYPENCTGHIADYPCGWSSFVQQQTYHLNISLQSSGDQPYCRGYPYQALKDIWYAANATKSHVMLLWWTPEAVVQTFAGTDFEFQKVHLPLPTQECFDNRIKTDDRCQENITLRIGSPLGSCDDQPQALQKIVTRNLYDISYGPLIPSAVRSPAYDAIQNFQVSGLQLDAIFRKWLIEKNEYGYQMQPRDAVCSWIVENYDIFETYIPRTYPRVVQNGDANIYMQPLFYVSFIIGILALVFVISVTVITYKLRKLRKVIKIAQVEFILLLLCGLMLIQFGAFMLALPYPSNATCITVIWCVNIGYTLELVPLIVKIAALNQLLQTSQLTIATSSSPAQQLQIENGASLARRQRLRIHRKHLFIIVALCTFMMVTYLTVWTIIDPPEKSNEYTLTDSLYENDETIVEVYSYCQSNLHSFWIPIVIGWRSLLLIWATVLAFQTRNCPVNFNESKTLAIMIYSQFIFLIWSLILYFLMLQNDENQSNTLTVTQIGRIQSLIYSFDVLSVCCIYFIPKLITTDAAFDRKCGNYNKNSNRKVHKPFGRSTKTSMTSTYFSETFRKSRSQSFIAATDPNASTSMAFDALRRRESDFHADSFVFAKDDVLKETNRRGITLSGSSHNDRYDSQNESITRSDVEMTHFAGSPKRAHKMLMTCPESSNEKSSESLRLNDSSTFIFQVDSTRTHEDHLRQQQQQQRRHNKTNPVIEEKEAIKEDEESGAICRDSASNTPSLTEMDPLVATSSPSCSVSNSSSIAKVSNFKIFNDTIVCSVQYVNEDGEVDEVIMEGYRIRKRKDDARGRDNESDSMTNTIGIKNLESNHPMNDIDSRNNEMLTGQKSLCKLADDDNVNESISQSKLDDKQLRQDRQQHNEEQIPSQHQCSPNGNKAVTTAKRKEVGIDFNMLFNQGGGDHVYMQSDRDLTPEVIPKLSVDDVLHFQTKQRNEEQMSTQHLNTPNRSKSATIAKRKDVGIDFNMLFGGFDHQFEKSLADLSREEISDGDDDCYDDPIVTEVKDYTDINTSQRQQYRHEKEELRKEHKPIISTVVAEHSSYMSDHSDLTFSEELLMSTDGSVQENDYEQGLYKSTTTSKCKKTTTPTDLIKRFVKKQAR